MDLNAHRYTLDFVISRCLLKPLLGIGLVYFRPLLQCPANTAHCLPKMKLKDKKKIGYVWERRVTPQK